MVFTSLSQLFPRQRAARTVDAGAEAQKMH